MANSYCYFLFLTINLYQLQFSLVLIFAPLTDNYAYDVLSFYTPCIAMLLISMTDRPQQE